MAKTREQKSAELSSLIALLQKAKGVVFANYRGIKVKDLTELRRNLRKEKIRFKVAKKTLYALAAKEVGLVEAPKEFMDGPVGVAVSETDPIAPARILHSFAKDHKEIKLLGGILEGKLIGETDVNQIALIPGREALLAQLLSVMNGPIRGFVYGLNEAVTKFVRTLSELSKQTAK